MNPAELRAAAQRVLLARCCEHPAFVDACECAEQVAADVDALIRAGLLRPPAPGEADAGPDHQEGPLMSRYTDPEIVLAERYVSVLDYLSRCAQAVEQGNWHYLWDKSAQLRHAAEQLQRYLSTEPGPDGGRGFRAPQVRAAAVQAAVAERARHYRSGQLLHPHQSGGERP